MKRTETRTEGALVTRLRAVLVARDTAMKVHELARAVGASADRVHRSLCWSPAEFVCLSGADRLQRWTVRNREDVSDGLR
jgi:hypothetical protein